MEEFSILDAESPTMVVRCKNMLILRSVITGKHLQILGPATPSCEPILSAAERHKQEQLHQEYIKTFNSMISLIPYENCVKKPATKHATTILPEQSKNPVTTGTPAELPPCKVQRNYCCTLCAFYTQNPRSHLLHQREVHGVRLSIHSCQYCQYASRYCQKLKRHIKMVHTLGDAAQSQLKTLKPRSEVAVAKDSAVQPIPRPKISQTNVETQPKPTAPPTLESTESAPPPPPPPIVVNPKSDPEAFFVSAYKNQLQIQLEYEQRLKKFLKSFDSETKNIENVKKPPPEAPAEKSVLNSIPVQGNEPPNTMPNISKPQHQHITEENTIQNIQQIEKQRTFSCRKCNYITHIKSRYNKHVKYHSMPMIQCNICEFRTTYKWNLTRHLRSHHGNGIYKCSVCSFSANMKQSLTSHEANHHSPPVGRALGNKPVRRRRCRVGGSDLQLRQGNVNLGVNKRNSFDYGDDEQNNDATFSNGSAINIKQEDINESGRDFWNTSASTTCNRTPEQNSFDNLDDSSMDCNDSDGSYMDSLFSSEENINDFENISDENRINTNNAPPIHVDADFLNDNVPDNSFQANFKSSESQNNEQKTFNNCTGYTSESSLSTSTISAEEAFDKHLKGVTEVSPLSSFSSEDINKSISSPSITSGEFGQTMGLGKW